MFARMMEAARQRLRRRSPEDAAGLANVDYDGASGLFRVPFLGEELTLRWPELTLAPAYEDWRGLLLLHYLDLADGTPVTGRLIPFSQMKDGLVRGGGFDRRCEQVIGGLMKTVSPQELERRCLSLGGLPAESNADLTAVFPLLPNFPMTLKVWLPMRSSTPPPGCCWTRARSTT
jgi:hypothetical protein